MFEWYPKPWYVRHRVALMWGGVAVIVASYASYFL